MGYIDVKSGIEAIHKDGGIAILAHPCEYDNYDEIKNMFHMILMELKFLIQV